MKERFEFFDNVSELEILNIYAVTPDINKEFPELSIGEILARVIVKEDTYFKFDNDNNTTTDLIKNEIYTIKANTILVRDNLNTKIYHLLTSLQTENSVIRNDLITFFDTLSESRQHRH